MKRKTFDLKILIIPVILLRLVFSMLFFHPDIKKINYQVQFFSSGVVNIYRYIEAHAATMPNSDTFNYPPLAYYVLGSWQGVASWLLGPALNTWLNDWGPEAYFHPRMFEFLLILKFPFLILDLLIGFLLLKSNRQKSTDYRLFILWFFNPVSLYAIYMLSGFDLLPVALTVLAWFFVKYKKILPAALMLGLGACIKSYPLLLLPFVLIRAKSWKQFINATLIASVGFILPLLPVINSPAFKYTMTHSNLMQGIFYANLGVSATQNIPLFVLLWGLVFWLSYRQKQRSDLTPEFISITLSVALLSMFHGQWILWSLPFLIFAVNQNFRLWPATAALSAAYFAVVWLIPDLYSLPGLFSPINPQVVFLPSVYELVAKLTQPEFIQSLFHTVLTASGFWFIYSFWKSYASE